MLPYFTLVGIPAIVAMYNAWRRDRSRNRIVINAFFFLWLLLLLLRKETVGVDIHNYSIMFRSAVKTPYAKIFSYIVTFEHEFGFYFLSKLLSVFTRDFRILLTVVSLISLIPVWRLYQQNVTEHPFLTVALILNIGIFSIYFSCLRQVIAISFVLPAFRYTKERKLGAFLLAVFLAFLFHKSALILMLLYPTYHMKLESKSNLLLIIPAVGLCYLFRKPIFTFFRTFISEFYNSNLKETGAIAILILLLAFVAFSYLVTDERKMGPEEHGLRNILLLSAVLQIFAGINPLAMRLNYYFLLFVPFIVPKMTECASEKNKTLCDFLVVIMVCFFTGYYFYDAYTDVSTLRIYPYLFFWN